MSDNGLLIARARDARELLRFHSLDTDAHPHGVSGLRFLTPDSGSGWDTSKRGWRYSEWGNAAGFSTEEHTND